MTNYNEAAKRDDKSRVPKFDPRQMDKWELLIRAYLKRDQAEYVLSEPKPTVDVDKQATLHGDAEEGDETKDERIYLKWVKQEEERWVKKNGIAYSLLVESCEGHPGALIIIMASRGHDNAKELFEALLRKYRLSSTAILQMELATFNGMNMGADESGLDFVDRIEG